MKRQRILLCWVIALCLAGAAPRAARAQDVEIPCVMTAEDVGNGYEYTIPGIGSFTVNGMNGEEMGIAVFSMDEGLTGVLYRDGLEADFNNGVVMENGSYELRIFKEDAKLDGYGVFRFSVKNSYGEEEDYGYSDFVEVENPPLSLEYDASRKLFCYMLPDGEKIWANVPLGAWSRTQAYLELSSGLNVYRVVKDGEVGSITQELRFSQPGSYFITLRDNELGLRGDTGYKVDFSFVLYTPRPVTSSHINAPLGFLAKSATRNGEPVKLGSGEAVHLDRDGTYEIRFEGENGTEWQMELERDTVPPSLKFSEDVTEGKLEHEVSFVPTEAGCEVRIYKNGTEVYAQGNRIAQNGRYRIVASDRAGNERIYRFLLQGGYQMFSKEMILIPVLLLAAAAAAVLHWRKDTTVL